MILVLQTALPRSALIVEFGGEGYPIRNNALSVIVRIYSLSYFINFYLYPFLMLPASSGSPNSCMDVPLKKKKM